VGRLAPAGLTDPAQLGEADALLGTDDDAEVDEALDDVVDSVVVGTLGPDVVGWAAAVVVAAALPPSVGSAVPVPWAVGTSLLDVLAAPTAAPVTAELFRRAPSLALATA